MDFTCKTTILVLMKIRMHMVFGISLVVAFLAATASCLAPQREALPETQPIADANSAATETPEATEAAWLVAYPFQAATQKRNEEMLTSPTGYGGSTPFARTDLMPELGINFRGSAFAVEYHEDRGHAYAMQDLVMSKRVTKKTPGACITCKTSAIGDIFAEKGWAYANEPLEALNAAGHPTMSCSNCHDLETGHLEPKQPGFLEALARTGKDFSAADPFMQEAYTCAQCHAEYYFEPGTSRVIHPWDEGLSAGDMYNYYAGTPGGFQYDYMHTDSGAALLKAQHPDFEEFSAGVHASAGVSCADCHMPRVMDEGSLKTSHFITSPLKNVAETCGSCHTERNAEWLTARVKDTQDRVFSAQRDAGKAVADAHTAIAAAESRGVAGKRVVAARSLIREAQWYWDFVASANSMGFHAPAAALGDLAKATDLAHKARLSLYE
ncbi:MAG: hypothetical protein A2Y38_23585 [Spirochaetes bacterium GWB1_59_5]|nr:MAG: hypothetical protein A2Y38_23585 [Spirochaetes bacterium GWB1_59_5]